jgi:glycosyltransferase involved in cell wall biosynthesis
VSFVVGDYGQPARERRDGITLSRAYRPDPDASVLAQPVHLWKLRKAMSRAGADLYVYRGHPRKAALTYLLAGSLGKPWVYNLANDQNIDEHPAALSPPVRWLFRHSLSGAAAVIAQTPDQAQRIERRYDIQPTVVPNGYPVNTTIEPHQQRDHFLWVGRLDQEQKRPHHYLDLAARHDPETFLLVSLDGQDEAYNNRIRKRAEQLGNVVDVGTVPPDAIHDLYRDAIALVNTSAYEGFPNTFLEAWRYETPVISLEIDPSRFVGPDIDGHAGGDLERLADLTADLATDVGVRKSLGEPAGAYVRSELSIETVAQQYGQVLTEALEASKRDDRVFRIVRSI